MEFVLLYGPPRKYIYAAFKTNAKLTKKQLEEATHLAVSRIVGAVHILIQVEFGFISMGTRSGPNQNFLAVQNVIFPLSMRFVDHTWQDFLEQQKVP